MAADYPVLVDGLLRFPDGRLAHPDDGSCICMKKEPCQTVCDLWNKEMIHRLEQAINDGEDMQDIIQKFNEELEGRPRP